MTKLKPLIYTIVCAAALLISLIALTTNESKGVSPREAALNDKETLGKFLFFDANLSEPTGQSCADCHDPAAGFAEPNQTLPVSEGIIPGRFGNRNSPPAAYASFSPEFDPEKTLGGQFWDGRAANLVEQAKGPLLNPVEMNNPDKQAVVDKVAVSQYSELFELVFGPDAFSDVEMAYHNIAVAIAAYEASEEVNMFTSVFDAYQAGLIKLNAQEKKGKTTFQRPSQMPSLPSRQIQGRRPDSLYRLRLPQPGHTPEYRIPILTPGPHPHRLRTGRDNR